MKLRYHIATISFCTNLTTAESEAIPVGVLVVGEFSDHSMALLLVREDRAFLDRVPDLIRSIVRDFPEMLQAQLAEILDSEAGGSIDDVMRVFEESLRNSFFVSDLKWNQEITIPARAPAVEDPWGAAYPSVMKRASEGMIAAHVTPDAIRQQFKPWMHRPHRNGADARSG